MGVWIETITGSLTSDYIGVTPHVGVWIETTDGSYLVHRMYVTPHVGVWIETRQLVSKQKCLRSLPTWECGLKLQQVQKSGCMGCHSPRGSVD